MSQPAKRGRKAWSPPEGVEIDWTRPAMHIAADCGVLVHAVLKWMRDNGIPIRPRGVPAGRKWEEQKRQRQKLDPSNLDWTRQDTALAKAHGVTRERIRQLRKAAGLPASGSAEWLVAGGKVTNPPKNKRRLTL